MAPVLVSMLVALGYASGDAGRFLAGFFAPTVPLIAFLVARRRPGTPKTALTWLAVAMALLLVRNILSRAGVHHGDALIGINLAALIALLLVSGSLISLSWWRNHTGVSTWNFDAALDSALIVSGGVACILCLLTLPAMAAETVRPLEAVTTTVIPILDMAVIAAVTYLLFVSPPGLPARWLLLASVMFLFAFDMTRATTVQQGLMTTPPVANMLLALAYGLLGSWALHPTMPLMRSPLRQVAQSWTTIRVVVLAMGLLAPVALIAVTPAFSPQYVTVLVCANVFSTLLILIRSVRAVRAYARAETALKVQAERDGLTGLANRPAFRAHVTEMLALARHTDRTVSVVYVDLNGFKAVNDTMGHAAGDDLLVEVGRRMVAGLRADDFPTRLGGDEFALVCLDDGAGTVGARLAQRMQHLFDPPFTLAGATTTVRGAVGWANTADVPDGSGDSVVSAADRAMYEAKRAGALAPVRAAPPNGEPVTVREPAPVT